VKERSVEATLVREAEKRSAWAIKLSPLSVVGLPDRLILAPGGRAAFAELKKPGLEPSAIQRYVHEKLRGLGFRVAVIDQHRDCGRFLEEWLGCSEPTS
jgi:hypothetical protein